MVYCKATVSTARDVDCPNSRGSIHIDDRPVSPMSCAVSLYTRLNLDLIKAANDNLVSDLILNQQGGILSADAFLTCPDTLIKPTM